MYVIYCKIFRLFHLNNYLQTCKTYKVLKLMEDTVYINMYIYVYIYRIGHLNRPRRISQNLREIQEKVLYESVGIL